jgi:hypothetical protein
VGAVTRGRPPKLTAAKKMDICRRIAEGESLRAICRKKDMPNRSQVFESLAGDRKFADQYERARQMQAEGFADEIIELADKSRRGKKEKLVEGGKSEVTTGDMVERSKLQIDARKWVLSKLLPKKYGDRLELDSPAISGLADAIREGRERARRGTEEGD